MLKRTKTDMVLIDGRKAQGIRTGIGHYTRQLLLHWPDNEAVVAFNSGQDQDSWSGETRYWRSGPIWHVKSYLTALKTGARYFSPESMLVPIALGRHSVITIHDLSPFSHTRTHTKWNVFLHKTLFRIAVKRVGSIIVPTEAIKADLLAFEPSASSKTVTIYEGIRPYRTTEESRTLAEPYALYVGTIEPRKNVTELAKTFIAEAPATWKLKIVGKVGWLSETQLAEFQSTVQSNPRIEYHGYVHDDELEDLYRNASLFVYVSASEGFGLPIAEAMSFGLPVIHSDDPALVEVAGGAGIVVKLSEFSASLRQAIRRATELSEEETNTIRERAKKQSKKFDWRNAAEITRSLVIGG